VKHVAYSRPQDLSTDDLVLLRARLRKAIKILENQRVKTIHDDDDLKHARAYLRELQKECGKRFIQERLF
jgi:hypothetical protein